MVPKTNHCLRQPDGCHGERASLIQAGDGGPFVIGNMLIRMRGRKHLPAFPSGTKLSVNVVTTTEAIHILKNKVLSDGEGEIYIACKGSHHIAVVSAAADTA